MKRTFIPILILLSIVTSFSGCQKDNDNATTVSHLYGIYTIQVATSKVPIDLNFDDKETEDIMEELPSIKNSFLTIKENITEEGVFADQAWPVPENDGQEFTTPLNYLQSFNIGHCTINQKNTQLTFEWQKTIYSQDKTEQTADLSDDGNIKMDYETSVFTKKGWRDITVHLVYKKSSDIK